MENPSIIFLVRDVQISVNYGRLLQLLSHARVTISAFLTLKFYPIASTYFESTQLCVFALLLIFAALALRNYLKNKLSREDSANAELRETSAIHALSKIIIPNCSLWPEHYISLARSSTKSGTSSLSIPLDRLLDDIEDGSVLMRASSTELLRLIRNKVLINGWTFQLGIQVSDKIETLRWMISDELFHHSQELFREPTHFSKERLNSVEYLLISEYYSRLQLSNEEQHLPRLHDVLVWQSLDYIPHAFAVNYINFVQEFMVRKSSESFILSSLLFSRLQSKSKSRPWRFSTVLYTRISKVLGLLGSGPRPLRVLSLCDVSDIYSRVLEDRVSKLNSDASLRQKTIRELGVDGWRRERLSATWESALLRGGFLTRWILVLETIQ